MGPLVWCLTMKIIFKESKLSKFLQSSGSQKKSGRCQFLRSQNSQKMGPGAQSTGRKHTEMPRKENSESWRWHLKITSNSSHFWRKRFTWQGEELLSGYQLFTNCTREKDVGEGGERREKEWPLPQVFMFRVEVVVTPAWPADLLSIEPSLNRGAWSRAENAHWRNAGAEGSHADPHIPAGLKSPCPLPYGFHRRPMSSPDRTSF